VSEAHERLTELFGEAIELAPEERSAMIARVRESDGALADELASLLEADSNAKLATGGLAPTADLRPPAKQIEKLRIPGYLVLDVLGEGGMGTVYAAEQIQPRRRVAIKVLHTSASAALARFRAEAEIMARLDHPSIARVLEAGEADGHPFLAMEHVDGKTLDQHVEPLALDARLALFVQICDAVHHAHLKGVIHRDLKPRNVIVRPDGRPVVLDFGIAHLADGSAGTSMTRTGDMIGTPLYMSPEQARMESHAVDARTDVYTLGVILYELACDQLPYGERELPLPVLTHLITEEEPVWLGKRKQDLRGDLEAIAMKALEKPPEARYQSVAALADDVRRFRNNLPVSVRVPGAVERARRFVRRRPVVAATIAAGTLATTAFATIVTLLWLDARAARRTADDARARAEARTNQLVLRQARGALVRDPTEALAWLATLTPRGVDAGAAWAVADEAIARGVAKDVLHAHRDEVHWVEAFGDGFVSGAYDGRAIVWDPTPRVVFTAKHGRVHVVRPSSSGELAIGGDNGAVTVIARDGTAIALPGHAGDVQHVAWSPDGAWLITGDDHGNLLAWPHGRPPARDLAHGSAAIDTLSFAKSGDVAIAGDRDGGLATWDLAGGAHREAKAPAGIIKVWSDGARVLAADAEGNVDAWHGDGDRLVADRAVATGIKLKRAAFAPDGAWVALGGVGGAVLRVTGDKIDRLWTFRDQVRTLAVSPDARFLAFGSDGGELELRDLTTDRELALRGHGSRARHLAFARGELLSSDSEGVIRRWQLDAIPPALLDARAPVDKLASDGKRLATADANGDIALWTVATAGGVRRGHVTGRVTALAITGDVAVTGSAEGIVTWWSEPPVERRLHGVIKSIAVRGDRVAVATSTGAIALFTPSGDPAGTLDGNAGGVETIALDLTGTLLAAGGQDRVVRVWRRAGDTFAPLADLPGPQGDTHFVAFARDRLLSAGNDGRVLAWALRDGAPDPQSMQVLAQHTGQVTAFAVAGDAVVSAGHDAKLIRGRATVTIPDEAKALALGDDGTVYAVTPTGAAIRWADGVGVEIEHGARGVIALPGSRVALALDDGAVVIRSLAPHVLDDLAAALARATSFALPH
jgi:WD40 repeat protein/predicted Ser/Thr protein kinase